MNAAMAAVVIVISTLVNLGYTIGIKQSSLHPKSRLEYLGFVVDLKKQGFVLPLAIRLKHGLFLEKKS